MDQSFLNKSSSLFLLAFLVILFNTQTVWGRTPVAIDAKVDITQPTLGDIITYFITVNHDPDIVLHTPEYEIPEGFEKIENGKKEPLKVNTQTSQEFWLKLRVDKLSLIHI